MPSYHKPVHSQHFNGALYRKMSEDLHLTGKAQRTVHGYLRAVRQLADYCRKSPDQISETELRRYFLYLKNQRQFAYGSLRVALSGIQFFYRTTCPRDWNVLAMRGEVSTDVELDLTTRLSKNAALRCVR